MIYDKITNRKNYFSNPIFENVFTELKKININTLDGQYHFDDYYFKVMSYETKNDPQIIESHVREVDIQILLSGREKIELFDIESVKEIKPYDKKTDCIFYKSLSNPQSSIELYSGQMAVFFPEDIHRCQIKVTEETKFLKKIVIKVNEKFFSI